MNLLRASSAIALCAFFAACGGDGDGVIGITRNDRLSAGYDGHGLARCINDRTACIVKIRHGRIPCADPVGIRIHIDAALVLACDLDKHGNGHNIRLLVQLHNNRLLYHSLAPLSSPAYSESFLSL